MANSSCWGIASHHPLAAVLPIAALAAALTAAPATTMLAAQVGGAAVPRAVDAIERMRTGLAAKHYGEVIQRGNDLLSSSGALSLDEQMMLWQMLAAAYFPPDVDVQRPDSARLPLDALVRLAPDVQLDGELSWPGLDSLLERARSQAFAVVTRPVEEYVVSIAEPAYLTVVATRPARFRLTTVASASDEVTLQDSTEPRREALLRLRVHDGRRALISAGRYQLRVWAQDEATGDTMVIVHHFMASEAGPSVAAVAILPFVPPASTKRSVARRSAMVLGGLAFAGATVAFANGARAEGALRRTFAADERAMIVGAAMVGAAVMGFFTDRGQPADERMTRQARAEYDARVKASDAEARASAGRYRVTLRLDAEDR